MIENPVEWFQTKITDVGNAPDRKAALSEMKSFVLNAEKSVLNDIIHKVSLNAIFECLNNSAGLSDEDIEQLSVILYELLGQLSAKELFEQFTDFLQSSLVHKSGELTRIAVKLLEKNINENTLEPAFSKISPLIPDIVACLGSPEDRFPEGAKSVLIKIATNPFGIKSVFSNEIIKKLEEVMKKRDVAKIRVFEIVIAVSKCSPENLSVVIDSGLLDKILLEFSSDDVIMQLCILENLSNLSTSNHGLAYLLELEFVQNLEKNLLALKEKPMSLMLLPGIIEFFGTLCYLQPEQFVNHNPQIMELLFTNIDTSDEVLLGVLIKTVGQIASTSCGRHALNKYEDRLMSYFKAIGSILSTKNNLTISAMSSLCELLKYIPGNDNANLISKKWFEFIRPSVLDSLVKHSKLPFIECRLAAFGLLGAIACQQWGMQKIINYPGMVEFLLDRSTEFDKACKESKFSVVYNIVNCPNVGEIVDQQLLTHLNSFVREGPFYVPPDLQVATEGAA